MRLLLENKNFYFCAAHFLLGKAGPLEPLHGHSFHVKVELEGTLNAYSLMVDFNLVKKVLLKLLSQMNAKVLLPNNPISGQIKFNEDENETWYYYRDKAMFLFPKENVLLLPVSNITAETLSIYLLEEFWCRLQKEIPDEIVNLQRIHLWLEETPDCWAVHSIDCHPQKKH